MVHLLFVVSHQQWKIFNVEFSQTTMVIGYSYTYLYCFVVTSSCKGTIMSNKVILQNSGDCYMNSGPPFLVSLGRNILKYLDPPNNLFQFCWNIWTPWNKNYWYCIFGPLWNILAFLEFAFNTLCKGGSFTSPEIYSLPTLYPHNYKEKINSYISS